MLPTEVRATEFGVTSKLPFKLASLREVLIWRVLDLSESAITLRKAEQNVAAAILARSVMETTSVLFVLQVMAEDLIVTKEVGKFDQTVMAMLFGSKNKSTPAEAINVLKHIDRMDKKFPRVRSWYNDLSEIAHPNYQGLMGSYAEVMEKPLVMRPSGSPKRRKSFGDKVVVSALCACLEIARSYYTKLSNSMPEFCEACRGEDVSGV
jgi:hypothetical protein